MSDLAIAVILIFLLHFFAADSVLLLDMQYPEPIAMCWNPYVSEKRLKVRTIKIILRSIICCEIPSNVPHPLMDHYWYDEQTYDASQDPMQTPMTEVRFHMMTDAEHINISHVELS